MSRISAKVQIRRNLADTVVPNVTRQTEANLDRVADSTLADAQTQCPVGTPESTGIPDYVGGTLRDSLEIMDNTPPLVRDIGTDLSEVMYAQFVHDGTRKMKARPYLVNPFQANKNRFISDCNRIQVV